MSEVLRAIVIDDEADGVKALTLIIQKFIEGVETIASSSSPVEGITFINNYRPDIVFLDINMPVLNGFQVLENLDYKDFNLVFTTAHGEYGLKALKLGAVDYLLKPISIDELKKTIVRIREKRLHPMEEINKAEMLKLIQTALVKIPIPTKESVEYVNTMDIICIEADNHGSKLLLASRNMEIFSSRSLKEFEILLCKPGTNFIRLHHSFIVNINFVCRYIKEGGGYVVTEKDRKVPVSKTKKAEFLIAISIPSDNL